jgi:hypothetical protein
MSQDVPHKPSCGLLYGARRIDKDYHKSCRQHHGSNVHDTKVTQESLVSKVKYMSFRSQKTFQHPEWMPKCKSLISNESLNAIGRSHMALLITNESLNAIGRGCYVLRLIK